MITTSNEGLAAGSSRARRKRSVHRFVTSATQVVARKGESYLHTAESRKRPSRRSADCPAPPPPLEDPATGAFPMRRGLLLSAVLAIALSSVAVAPVADAAFPGQNGRIAYVTTAGDHRAIYTVDARGADPQPLVDLGSGRDAINPAWSWDGRSIAFAGQTSPGGPFAVY